MIDTQIHVAIKSYKRAGTVTTLGLVPFGWLWVPESQGSEYREHYGDRVITIPDELDGNLGRKQNAILDRSPCPWTLMLDDDITLLGYWESGDRQRMGPKELRGMVEHHFRLAEELDVKLWGIQQNPDELLYRTHSPFCLLSPILGPFHGHLAPELRYDESVGTKDDYDFWLQNIRTNRKTLRVNKYHYRHDGGKKAGGAVSHRTMAYEKACVERMRQKWGKLFRPGGTAGPKGRTGTNILNSVCRVPIPGC